MDLNKINSLLNDNFEKDDDINENDLEDELEAILSGRPTSKASSARPIATQLKPQPNRRNKNSSANYVPSKNVYKNVKSASPSNEDVFDVQKLMGKFDIENNSDDEIVDENDDTLLSELDSIVNSSTGHRKPVQNSEVSTFNDFFPHVNKVPKLPARPTKTLKLDNTLTETKPSENSLIDLAESSPSETVVNVNDNVVDEKRRRIDYVKKLQIEYKRAALKAKTNGAKEMALSHMKVSKQLDSILNDLNSSEDVDMSSLPPMPDQMSSDPIASAADIPENIPEMSQEEASRIFNAPKAVETVLDALEQRLQKFKSTLEQATAEQNTSKIRRLGRIVKQYETAIKDHKKGKSIDTECLPCPPGFPPIPTENSAPQPGHVIPTKSESQPKPSVPSRQAPVPPKLQPSASQNQKRPPLKREMSTVATKQLNYLVERQKLFKLAAIEAKKRGELEQAKEYLRHAKGFDPLIQATQNGLPIDATSIPTPPQLKNNDFVMIDSSQIPKINPQINDSAPKVTDNTIFFTDSERDELFRNVERELIDQIEMCNRNKEYFLKLGDVCTSRKFEKYANDSRKDLNMLLVRWRNNENVPSYRTETRTFSIVVSNPEVGLNEVHVEVVKAFDLPGRPEIDTYVKLEFPFPSDKPQYGKTKIVYNTLDPEFNECIKFEIDRKSRSLPRVLKRHPLKLEIFSKGGFLRSDTSLGAILVKMSDFETKCTVHECYPLTVGKKVAAGRLEVKVKIREPLLAKQVEEINEKWIVFS